MKSKSRNNNQKPWSGRFSAKTHRLAEELNASISFDKRLFRHDILGSIAHAKVLKRAGILTKGECERIIKGLRSIEREISTGRFVFSAHMEDIHMAVEKRLYEKIGAVAGKLHTARSRNDQVALDIRLYLRDELKDILGLLKSLKKALFTVAEKNVDTVMPGYTHLQRAQPVLFGHHMLAYYEMFKRDERRFEACFDAVDVMPLGSGALAGTPYALDRNYAARLLGFSKVSANSMDAVSDRDFLIEFLSAASVLMMHLSRLAEELILWSSSEFGFIELSDAFSTGSSIMPQKKNPDIAELARAKTGRVYGNLITLLTVMKGLPLSYNKDMQEDKPPVFDTIDTLKGLLSVFPPMLRTMKVKRDVMLRAVKEGFLTATDAADYLVEKGVPFREAHRAVGTAVSYCIKKGKGLEDLTLEEWRGFSKHFDGDIKKVVTVEYSLKTRRTFGGTAPSEVRKQLKRVERELKRG